MATRTEVHIDKDRPEKMRNAVHVALTAVGAHLEGIAELLAPRDTGRLAGSITWATAEEGSSVRAPAGLWDGIEKPARDNVVYIGTNVVYAAQKEYGGTIRAVNAKYLRFKTKDGMWHMRKSVYQKPQPFLRPAFDENRAEIKEIFREHLTRMVVNG